MVARLIAILLIIVGLLSSIIAAAWGVFAVLANPKSSRAHKILIGFDQIANASTGGSEDETISSRAYRARLHNKAWGCILCKMLDVLQKDHCKKSAGV